MNNQSHEKNNNNPNNPLFTSSHHPFLQSIFPPNPNLYTQQNPSSQPIFPPNPTIFSINLFYKPVPICHQCIASKSFPYDSTNSLHSAIHICGSICRFRLWNFHISSQPIESQEVCDAIVFGYRLKKNKVRRLRKKLFHHKQQPMKKKLNKRKMVPNSIVSTDSKELRKPFWHDDTVDRLNKIYLVSCFAKKYPKFIYLLHLPTISIHRTISEQERIGRKYIQQIRNLEKDAIQLVPITTPLRNQFELKLNQEQQEDKLEQQEDELKEDKELNEDDEELDEDDDELNEDLLIKKFLF